MFPQSLAIDPSTRLSIKIILDYIFFAKSTSDGGLFVTENVSKFSQIIPVATPICL